MKLQDLYRPRLEVLLFALLDQVGNAAEHVVVAFGHDFIRQGSHACNEGSARGATRPFAAFLSPAYNILLPRLSAVEECLALSLIKVLFGLWRFKVHKQALGLAILAHRADKLFPVAVITVVARKLFERGKSLIQVFGRAV